MASPLSPNLTAPLALTMGDPAGCGPGMTQMAWQALRSSEQCFFYIAPIEFAQRAFSIPVQEISHPKDAQNVFRDSLPVLSRPMPRWWNLDTFTPGTPDPASVPAITDAISHGVDLCLSRNASGLVTNPINKSVLYEAGFPFPGHTEYLGHLCDTPGQEPLMPTMMLLGGGLRVTLATIHVPLMQVGSLLSIEHLEAIIQITEWALRRECGIERPRIAFTGLNPHAGEGGSLGMEEIEFINPAAQNMRDANISITDAQPADTVFAQAREGAYDCVIAMTHDQGLIPIKTLDLWGGVNATVGMPIIRTSPDHGTAFDAVKAGKIRADSLIAAIHCARDMAENRVKFEANW